MEEQKLGTEEIKKVIGVIAAGGDVIEAFVKAESVMGKISALVPLAEQFLSIISISPAMLMDQFKDLDDAEKADLHAEFKARFDLDDDALEAKVEAAVALGAEALELIAKVVDYAKELKKKEA
jgi:hypothetical protein